MADWREVCCAIDFSGPSRIALEKAADLAVRLHSQLTLLHVDEAELGDLEENGLSVQEAAEKTLRDVDPRMASWHRWAEQAMAHPVRMKVLAGRAAEEILRFLRQGSFDLLVMGTHGRVGLAHFVIGSVAEEVERRAPCPVMVIRGS